MNSIKDECQYIIKKGKYEGCQCKVKNITNGWCFSHNPINQKVNIKYSNIKNKDNIKIDIKNIMKKFGVDFIEMSNIILLMKEEEDDKEEDKEEEEEIGFKIIENLELIVKPKKVVEKVVEKTKEQQVDELVEVKLNKVFKKYFYENSNKVREYFEDMDMKNEENTYENDNKPKNYEDKYYKSFELELYKLYKIKYRNNIEIFNTLKSYIDRDYFIHILIDEEKDKEFLKHKIFDKLMKRNIK